MGHRCGPSARALSAFAFVNDPAPALSGALLAGMVVVYLLIVELANSHEIIVTIEENVISGGAGSAVNTFLHKNKILRYTLNIGLPDAFVEQGTREELLGLCGLDGQGILKQIQEFVEN